MKVKIVSALQQLASPYINGDENGKGIIPLVGKCKRRGGDLMVELTL